MNIKVFCKVCNWTGQAIVDNKKGYLLEDYRCPVCGHSLRRRKGYCGSNKGYAVLKEQPTKAGVGGHPDSFLKYIYRSSCPTLYAGRKCFSCGTNIKIHYPDMGDIAQDKNV